MSVWHGVDPVWSPEWLWLGYATFLRATLILALVAAATALLRRAPGAVRAQLWAAALVALLPLPFLRALPLHWSAHLVPAPLAAPMVEIGALMVGQSSPAAVAFPWSSAAAAVWLIGVVAVLARLAAGWIAAAALAHRARPVRDARALRLLHGAAGELRMRRRVRLLEAREVETPLTWGTFRPAVLLPAAAAGWPDEHLRASLLHELAHVRRLDCALHLLARTACALWWFHPAAWWAARRLEGERELACDERVIAAGVRPSAYAECLLRLEGDARARSCVTPALAGPRRSRLDARVRAVLAPGSRPRRPARLALAAGAAASVALVLVAGSMRLAPEPGVHWRGLHAADWRTRAYAVENIARFGDEGSRRRLDAMMLREPEPAVRAMVAFGASLRAGERTPPLVRLGWPR